MDKDAPPPPTLHHLQMDKGLGAPPPPTLHDLQGFRPTPTLHDQGFRPPPQPFTTCKWTRVAGPPTLHDLRAASKWTRVGGPPQPCTICKWTRVGGPATLVGADFQIDKGWGCPPTRFANGQGLGPNPSRLPPQPCTTCRWTRVGGPNPSRLANGQGLGGPPTLHDLQTSSFVWTSIGASKPSNA